MSLETSDVAVPERLRLLPSTGSIRAAIKIATVLSKGPGSHAGAMLEPCRRTRPEPVSIPGADRRRGVCSSGDGLVYSRPLCRRTHSPGWGLVWRRHHVTGLGHRKPFRRLRGVPLDGHPLGSCILALRFTLLHLHRECKKHANLIFCSICRPIAWGDANEPAPFRDPYSWCGNRLAWDDASSTDGKGLSRRAHLYICHAF